MAAEGTLSWGGEKFTITDDFLLLSAILFKDIKRSILGSPNIQFPRLLGAFGGSDDLALVPDPTALAGPGPGGAGFLLRM